MKNVTLFFLFASFSGYAQNYLALPQTPGDQWIFYHYQFPGELVDTLEIGAVTENGFFELLIAESMYFNKDEPTPAGQLKYSQTQDSIWYIAPDKTEAKLIFNLNLELGDTFSVMENFSPTVIDISKQAGRKVLTFDTDDGYWHEPLKFIEGFGPTWNPLAYWSLCYCIEPISICLSSANTEGYTHTGSHFEDCQYYAEGVGIKEFKTLGRLKTAQLKNGDILFSTAKSGTLRVVDVLGKTHVNKEILQGKHLVKAQDLAKGSYVISMQTADAIQVAHFENF